MITKMTHFFILFAVLSSKVQAGERLRRRLLGDHLRRRLPEENKEAGPPQAELEPVEATKPPKKTQKPPQKPPQPEMKHDEEAKPSDDAESVTIARDNRGEELPPHLPKEYTKDPKRSDAQVCNKCGFEKQGDRTDCPVCEAENSWVPHEERWFNKEDQARWLKGDEMSHANLISSGLFWYSLRYISYNDRKKRWELYSVSRIKDSRKLCKDLAYHTAPDMVCRHCGKERPVQKSNGFPEWDREDHRDAHCTKKGGTKRAWIPDRSAPPSNGWTPY